MEKNITSENNELDVNCERIKGKFPKNLISFNIEKRKPIILDREIYRKRKIIANIFNKRFGKSFFDFKPEALAIFENNFKKYFFHSKSPLLDQSKVLRKIFKKNIKRRKIRELQNKIDMGQLDFYSLRTKKTKKDVTDSNRNEKYFSHSKNFSINPSKDIVELEFIKVKKEDEDNKHKKYFRMYIQNNKDIYSSKNSDSNSEQIDFSQNKNKQHTKHSLLTLTNRKTYSNNYIKINENENNIDIKEYNYKKRGKNKTEEILENLNNVNSLYSSFRNKNNNINSFNKTVTSELNDINKLKLNSLIQNNSSSRNNSISYKNGYLLQKPFRLQKNWDNFNYLYSTNYNNINQSTNQEKGYNFTTKEENSNGVNGLNSLLFKKNKQLNPTKKKVFKRNFDNKIINLNTYTNKCNNKLIKLIDVNKTTISQNKFFSKKNKDDIFQVDIKKLLIDKKIKTKKPIKNKSEIKQIFRQTQKIANKKLKNNPKKEKRNFAQHLNRMSDDLALLMADKIFRAEIKLRCKRAVQREKEMSIMVNKDKKEIRINKLREKAKQNYNHMVYLENLISYAKRKVFN